MFKGNGQKKSERLSLARQCMVDEQIARRGIRDEKVLAAMRKIERHCFLPEKQWDSAYADHPLPIGEGQTISQPYIVALMTEALRLTGGEKVLEVGGGSGYQTAILAELTDEVYSMELLPCFAERTRTLLAALGYGNIHFRTGDGNAGWPEHAPFDAILVAAAPEQVPDALLMQLKEAGRLVIPVGALNQELELHIREGETVRVKPLGAVRFVPLV